jgi:ABC-type phosphate transport system substrate-binding protein
MLRLAYLVFLLLDSSLLLGAWPHWPAQQKAAARDVLPPASENLAIVVNEANPVKSLSTAELRRIYLGQRGHWPNGRRITIVMMEPGQQERAAVLREICQMSETEFSNHFLHGLFTGEVLVSPKTLSSVEGVRKFVVYVPGAIGYLRASDVDGTVKVVRIDEQSPGDKGYPFHVAPPATR